MACGFCATGQAGFNRHLSSGEIVEQVLVHRGVEDVLQLLRHSAAFLRMLGDGLLALLQFAEEVESVGDRLQPVFVHAAGRSPAIAGDEGGRGVILKEGHGGRDVIGRAVELGLETIESGLRGHGGKAVDGVQAG